MIDAAGSSPEPQPAASKELVPDHVLAGYIDEYQPGCTLHRLLVELCERRAGHEPCESYVRNCEIEGRAGEQIIGLHDGGCTWVRLDGYTIRPKESSGSPQAAAPSQLVATLNEIAVRALAVGPKDHNITLDEIRAISTAAERLAPPPGAEHPPGDGWSDNARYLLDQCPHTIRVREGNGPEDLLSSLVLTFQKMQGRIADFERALVYSAFAQHATPLHQLPERVALIDGDTVEVRFTDNRRGAKITATWPPRATATKQQEQPPVVTHIAILEHHDAGERVILHAPSYKAVLVPPGQSLDFDVGPGATRRWLWPYLGRTHHLVDFVEVASSSETKCEGHS
jgi:hypothetical protein